ncbi:uncharacterized protein LOC119354144 [Triticum dicoccoides]|uniref:uncharacterized protein LOC119354144 n=1 Tax=Triticum dicoccoides TaxID=85692 RepID=UPI000E7C7368|nr:uncharacterized protein LOC119354144 [Triticum dicoccoides]
MSSQQEVFTVGVLHVTVHHVYYPVSEETLHQVFTMYGVVNISMFQRIHHVEAVVQLRSRSEAARALAMHGRCIYERSCLLDIQDVSPEYNLHLCSLLEQKQTTTMAEYTTTFLECVQRVLDINPNLSIKSFIHQYILGLRGDIQDVVRLRSPSSITGASSLARIREDEIAEEVAMAAEKPDDDRRVHVLMPTVIVADVFPELAAPTECGADHGVISIDSSSLAATTSVTCSMECSSHDATFDIFLEPTAPTMCEGTLDIEAISVVAPMPMAGSTSGLACADVNIPVVAPLILGNVTPSSASPPEVPPTSLQWPFSILEQDTMASIRCLTLYLDHIGVLTPMYILDESVKIKQQGQVSRPMPWPSFKCRSELANPQDPWTTTQGIFGKLSTDQPYEDLKCCVARLALLCTSSSDGNYLQVIAALRSLLFEFYNIGEAWGHWHYAYMQQCRSSQPACYLECMRAGDAILNMELTAQVLFNAIPMEFVSKHTNGVCDFLRAFDQEEELNSISEPSEQATRLCYVELTSSAYSSLHFIKPCCFGLGMQGYSANGRLSPDVSFSTTNIMLLP